MSNHSVKKVLVLCTGNACRSQMAEGFLRHAGGDGLEVVSAGTRPTKLNEAAVLVMKEIGVDISKQHSKSVDGFLGWHFDYVITVCDNAKESCPVFPGKSVRLHWQVPDPPHDRPVSEDVLNDFRKVRGIVRGHCESFLKTIHSLNASINSK